ncbi:hypothetical protein M3194_06825 [Paenibacillus glycanilyticus]|uniref:hypothetical protein n=1 Tax=Paenibacillus glycanilyticus TaxID=126569 RepID=UPI00204241B8|nr:hypothetical protein [Paenibacillus glycanilyticus]MCM3627074.1 hypothetical protein [Paenibacillus glycanilyticus]
MSYDDTHHLISKFMNESNDKVYCFIEAKHLAGESLHVRGTAKISLILHMLHSIDVPFVKQYQNEYLIHLLCSELLNKKISHFVLENIQELKTIKNRVEIFEVLRYLNINTDIS